MSIKKQIKEILENIDNVAEKSKYLHEVANEYQKARDLYFKELKDEKSAQKMQWIMDVLNFVISDNTLKEMMSGTTKDGKPWKYPDISAFPESGFKEVEKAFKTTKSITLKARYADFFWLSKKDYKKARIAIDSYFKLIKKYEEADTKNPSNHYGLDVLDSFKRAFQISKSISYKKDEVKNELKRLCFNFNPNSSSKFKLTIDLVEIAINNKKDFRSKEFWGRLVAVCENHYKKLCGNKNWYFARDYLNSAKKIEMAVLNKKTNKWDKLIAESYLFEADSHKSQKSFAELSSLINAIEEYQKLKDVKKVEELKKRYKESSKDIQFNEFKTEIDLSKVIDDAKRQAEELSKLQPEEVFKYLVVSPNLFPRFDNIEKTVNENEKKFVFQHLCNQSIFDHNMNIAREYCSEEEKHFAAILQQFGISLVIYRVYLEIIIEKLIEQNILTWTNTKAFLKKYSWYKETYEIKNREGKILLKTQKWIDLIEPGIKLYLTSTKKYLKGKKKKISYSNIILASDSLVMKIEGLIREIFQILDRPTFVIRKEKGDKSITIEKDLNTFLVDDFAKQIFNNDLRLLMRFLLTEPSGHNLRNNIGHCLIQREHYNLLNLHLLFLVILRLGNYKFEKIKISSTNQPI
jgi:hypothetical protein